MMKIKSFLYSVLVSAGIFVFVANCFAKDYTFTWTANEEPVEGYKLYYKKGGVAAVPFDGSDAGGGASPIILGNVTTYTVTGLDAEAVYHFALTAYFGSEESSYSAIITINPNDTNSTVPAPELLILRKN